MSFALELSFSVWWDIDLWAIDAHLQNWEEPGIACSSRPLTWLKKKAELLFQFPKHAHGMGKSTSLGALIPLSVLAKAASVLFFLNFKLKDQQEKLV